MNLNLITLATVKTQLGIVSGNTAYDASITAMIPIVSSDIRRILNCSYDKYISAAFSSSSKTISFYDSVVYNQFINTWGKIIIQNIELGQIVCHDNIPDDTYLSSFDPITGTYQLSATPIGSGTFVYPTITISMFPTISKMIWYKISKMNITDSIASGIQSESYGPVSITYSDKEINKQYDYPNSLIADLGIPFSRVG